MTDTSNTTAAHAIADALEEIAAEAIGRRIAAGMTEQQAIAHFAATLQQRTAESEQWLGSIR